MKIFTTLLFLLLSQVHATTYLAFFEFYTYQGQLIQLEENGRFSHVAISNGEFWLHAHPGKGVVEAVQSLGDMNFYKARVFIYENPDLDISNAEMEEYIGAPYDRKFKWRDRYFYNAELIGQLFRWQPSPMNFSSSYWQNYSQNLPQNALGFSPDDIFELAIKNGFEAADY